jgi:hypothetical protein
VYLAKLLCLIAAAALSNWFTFVSEVLITVHLALKSEVALASLFGS